MVRVQARLPLYAPWNANTPPETVRVPRRTNSWQVAADGTLAALSAVSGLEQRPRRPDMWPWDLLLQQTSKTAALQQKRSRSRVRRWSRGHVGDDEDDLAQCAFAARSSSIPASKGDEAYEVWYNASHRISLPSRSSPLTSASTSTSTAAASLPPSCQPQLVRRRGSQEQEVPAGWPAASVS